MNSVCKKNGCNLFLVAAIRSEVVNAIESSGKEINKIMSDFSTPIIWHQSGGSLNDHPILKIIIKRLRATENIHGLSYDDDSQSLWNRYFPQKVQNESTEKYILHLTWYRPRDVIRLLNIARIQSPNETSFSHKVFDAIRKTYSTESWTELTEELRAIYKEEEIDGIKRILYGIKNPFYFKDLKEHIDDVKEMYRSVDALMEKHKLGEILSNLYRVGLIGNSGEKFRFAHRGDDDILLDKEIMIHRALWQSLSIERNSSLYEKRKQRYNKC